MANGSGAFRGGLWEDGTPPRHPMKGGGILFSKVLIVGGGEAGMSAALALVNLGHAVELVEKKGRPGGLASRLDLTFPDRVPGSAVVSPLAEKVSGSGAVTVRLGIKVVSWSRRDGRFEDWLSSGRTAEADAVIFATGLEPLSPGLAGAGDGIHRGVVTSWELEDMMRHGPVRRADGSPPGGWCSSSASARGRREKEYRTAPAPAAPMP